jgi:RHH-type rel operon transcriptional repressor/antitoxin RelB
MSTVVATRFPPEVIAELDEVARERKRTRAEIIREAVQIYLSEWADYAIALERLNDPNDPILSEEEFWTEVDKESEAKQAGGSVTDGRG